ncbi:MAG TPA: bifunctional phosphoglucose/phosphomannose isomerase [Chitinophagales bacterium]|nr:bifunctional phosphoglucose/phosphomannose isomerase [Chitinophagales bacterium]
MYQLIKDFPAQINAALEIGEKAVFNTKFTSPIKNIVVSGLGGSGIGGNLLAELLRDELKVPVVVNKGYTLPAFIDNSTLLILCSYSGNTEETVTCANLAAQNKWNPICITSGGKLADIAVKNNFDLITIPSGFPPRACLGYSIVGLFYVLNHFGLIGDSFKAAYKKVANLLQAEQADIMKGAEALAADLKGKVMIVYADEKYDSVAVRIKQQFNENSKSHSWVNVFPEVNHNELVGWRRDYPSLAIVVLRADDEYKRNTYRIEFTEGVIKKTGNSLHEIKAKGADTFEKHFYLIHWGDWLSYYLAVGQGFDPMEIEVLTALKHHMSSIVD